MESPSSQDFAKRENCPSCGSLAPESLVSVPFSLPLLVDFLMLHYEGRADVSRVADARFEVKHCLGCGLVFQSTVPAGSLLSEIYDRWIPKSEKERLRESYALADYRYMAAQVDFLVQHFRLRPARIDVFDFGFGWAEWANVARCFGCNVFGSELSADRLDHARSIGITTIDWDDIPKHKFHYINTEQVFEHLTHPRETLDHLVKAMRPDGIIKISVPNGRGIRAKLKGIERFKSWNQDRLLPIQPLEHINCFDYSSLVELGKRANLRPVRPSIRQLYNSSCGWLEPRNAARNLLRPLYRHIYPRSTFVYFAKAA